MCYCMHASYICYIDPNETCEILVHAKSSEMVEALVTESCRCRGPGTLLSVYVLLHACFIYSSQKNLKSSVEKIMRSMLPDAIDIGCSSVKN